MPSGSKGYAHETEKGKTRPPCKSRLLRPSGFGEPPTPNNPGKLCYTSSAVTLDSRVYPARQLPWRTPLFGENSEPQDQHLLRTSLFFCLPPCLPSPQSDKLSNPPLSIRLQAKLPRPIKPRSTHRLQIRILLRPNSVRWL